MKPAIPYPVLVAALGATMVAFAFLSMIIGPAAAGTFELISMMSHGQADTAWMIMREVRLPRTLLALMEGATLGLSGAVLQGFLRNPLVDPGVVGISSGASMFAVLGIYTGLSALFPLALPIIAIVGALICVMILQALAGRGGVLTLVLAGVAVANLANAVSYLALNLSPNPYAGAEITFWLMGSVTDRSLDHVALAAPFMIAGWLVLAWAAPALDALSLGEEAAASLGVNVRRTRSLVVFGSAICVGAGTAVTGGIGFVGLVVPHLLRPLVGHSPSRLLLASALGGGALLLAADILVRLIYVASELKLGVVTALIGAPFFLWLIFRARTELEFVKLEAKGITVVAKDRTIVSDASLSVSTGELVGLIGPNGAGKSTLLRAMLGIRQKAAGSIMLDGRDFLGLPGRERARALAFLPQERRVEWRLPAYDIVMLGRYPHQSSFGGPTAQDRAAVQRALDAVDGHAIADRPVVVLSGGERTRILLARALAVEAPILLADEPIAALDPYHQLHVMEILRERAHAGAGVLAVIHDLTLAVRFMDRLVLMNEGGIAADGRPEEVLTPERLAAVYRIDGVAGLQDGQRFLLPWSRRND